MQTEVMAAPETPKRMGVRELSKQESQHKILLAARQLFAELGYDRATLRQIAAQAGLTVGALFKHVSDKRDLIYFIFNEEVDTITEIALAAPRPYQTFQAKILSITEPFFRLFANEPVLSRILLIEIVSESPGFHRERYLSIRARLFTALEQLIAEAQQSGELQATESPQLVSLHIFFTFAASLRRWLASSSRPEWREGHKEYERLLKLQMHGLTRAEDKTSTPPRKKTPAR